MYYLLAIEDVIYNYNKCINFEKKTLNKPVMKISSFRSDARMHSEWSYRNLKIHLKFKNFDYEDQWWPNTRNPYFLMEELAQSEVAI